MTGDGKWTRAGWVGVLGSSLALEACTTPPPLPRAMPGPAPGATIGAMIAAPAAPVDFVADAGARTGDATAGAGVVDDELSRGSFLWGVPEAGTESAEDALDTGRALEDAALERHTFRHVLVGETALPPRRLTWELFRGREHIRLRLFCQTVPRGLRTSPWRHEQFPTGIHANGQENEEASWTPPVQVAFEGARAPDGTAMRLVTAADMGAMWRCTEVVRVLIVTCRPDHVEVLSSRAELTHDDASDTWRWKPAAGEKIAALSCTITRERDADSGTGSFVDSPMRSFSSSHPLVFVESKNGSPGVEWVYENSESIVQMSAYRWMAVRP